MWDMSSPMSEADSQHLVTLRLPGPGILTSFILLLRHGKGKKEVAFFAVLTFSTPLCQGQWLWGKGCEQRKAYMCESENLQKQG